MPLSPRDHALVARAELYAAEVIAPHAARWEQRREALPRNAFLRYGQEGFSGLMVPEAQGGQGARCSPSATARGGRRDR